MLDINEIAKRLDASIQPLLDVLDESGIDIIGGTSEAEGDEVQLQFSNSHNASMFIHSLIQTNETDESSLSSRIFTQDSSGGINWSYDTQIMTNFKDHDQPDFEFGFSMLTLVSFPTEDYAEVLTRLTEHSEMLAEPDEHDDDEAGFCKGCFIVNLERLIEIGEFMIWNPETRESLSGPDIEDVSMNGSVVQISLSEDIPNRRSKALKKSLVPK